MHLSSVPPEAAPAQGNEIESQIADLQKKLRITTAQQPLFDAFAQIMRQNAQALGDAVTAITDERLRTDTVTQIEDLQHNAPSLEIDPGSVGGSADPAEWNPGTRRLT